MKQLWFFCVIVFWFNVSFSQKRPLDHSVYDSWQSIGERKISNDGKWVIYAVNPQEGDNDLVIQSITGNGYKKRMPGGYNAEITEDSRFVIFKVKPFFKDIRQASIRKKKPEDFPKDSLLILELGTDNLKKVPEVKSYKTPEKSGSWVAYLLEKKAVRENPELPDGINKEMIDSLRKVIDSLTVRLNEIKANQNLADENHQLNLDLQSGISEILDETKDFTHDLRLTYDFPAGEYGPAPLAITEGTDLVVRKLETGEENIFKNVIEYYFDKSGRRLLIETTKAANDSLSNAFVIYYDLINGIGDTLSRGGNDFRNFAFADDGSQVAYLAERDSRPNDLQKFYRIWYYKFGLDSAALLVDKNSVGMKVGMTISENGALNFSKSGNRLFFGTAPIMPPKDTTLADIDLVKLDIWHYNDDYLQTQQLFNLQNELKRNYLAVCQLDKNRIMQLGSKEIPTIIPANEGDGDLFVGVTDFGKRIETQWNTSSKNDIYAIRVESGEKKLVKKDIKGSVYASSTGKFILWYENKAKNYFTYDGDSIRNISRKMKISLSNEEFDLPDDPNAYGFMRWLENDEALFVYDRYDIWQLDPLGKKDPLNITSGQGRKTKTAYRYIQTDPEEKFVRQGQILLLSSFNEANKKSGAATYKLTDILIPVSVINGPFSIKGITKADNADVFIYTKETYIHPPDIYVNNNWQNEVRLSSINPQQLNYNWGTAELFKWRTFNGRESTGILYKPEDFDSTKKYPLILYFYEKLSDGLYQYTAPTPTSSRINIPFFVSRGYLIMTPDISYTRGHPAKDAYDYIVSGAQALARKKWVDGKNIGIQGQSWGGIQVAQLVTMTDMFKVAWAGAPVANMTSAYNGIRWESGRSRQFQYEKSQSRIGASLWEKQELYIENSPLFHVPKIKTPMVIMANDADGAVPWYQGIELFSAMRRLGKKVWMLTYNGEAHNLRERKNQKDLQIRQQQFFDWLLKGEKPAKWITKGVPAVKKGIDWGLEIVD